ncbi:MAG: methylated-DNA--[protein]-cysteine S-methyltransferase, partial [Candidatus Rokuibacteriota bacterium]
MNEGKAQDQLDRLLADYFRPETAPTGLARKLTATAREAETALTRLEGKLGIEATPRGISLVCTGRAGKPATAAARKLTEQAREEIHEYLRGQRAFFRVPVDLAEVGDFQRQVLEAARLIPFGEARPYAWIAARIGHPRAVRAVGTALGRNPVPLILPCHRVWRSDGGHGGYIFGAAVKDRLAALERATPVLEGCTSTR